MSRRRAPRVAALLIAAAVTLPLLGPSGAAPAGGAEPAAGVESSTATARVLSGARRPPPSGYRQVIVSDFIHSTSPWPGWWNRCFWWEYPQGVGCNIASNDEMQWYRARNVSSQDGYTRLTARRETYRNHQGRTYSYTSGMIQTGPSSPDRRRNSRAEFTYGYVEARIRVPYGRGFWPMFWLLPSDEQSRPEIDIMEMLGQDPYTPLFHYHYRDRSGTRRSLGHHFRSSTNHSSGWHTYAVDWRPGQITWIVDGRERWQVNGPDVSAEPMYVLLNLAVGGSYPGPPSSSTRFPAYMDIDWVKVWQRDGWYRRHL